ncbi:hypothetical protein AAur_pTC20235 (plasmid) [Paenarthrobacter aurescens TC1]|uniref:Uncharacterized protein n=1 Tax=Paenarthrobacter aurescens (strain TC1) TaxID=290340 RepID=A1RDS1_PAEAT|nr:hypothetical protein AAur_pTC20235 [Paenarthrobacter aurescens TC1]
MTSVPLDPGMATHFRRFMKSKFLNVNRDPQYWIKESKGKGALARQGEGETVLYVQALRLPQGVPVSGASA